MILTEEEIKKTVMEAVKTPEYWAKGEFGREAYLQDQIAIAQARKIMEELERVDDNAGDDLYQSYTALHHAIQELRKEVEDEK